MPIDKNRLQQLHAAGASWKRISRTLGVSYWSAITAARSMNLPKRCRRLSANAKQKLLDQVLRLDLSLGAAAAAVGVSKATAFRVVVKVRSQSIESAGAFAPTRAHGKRCTVHGPVSVWPCVACEALRARQNKPKRHGQNG